MRHLLLGTLPLAASACVEPRYADLGDAAQAVDTAAPDTDACDDLDGVIGDLVVTPTAMPTVFDLSWETADPAAARLRVVDEWGVARWTEATAPGLTHSHRLTGLAQMRDYDVRVEVDGPDGTTCGASVTVQTGVLSSRLPPLHVRTTDAATPGYRLVPILGDGMVLLAIIDERGEYVWAYDFFIADRPGAPGLPIVFKVEVAADGTGVFFNTQSDDGVGDGVLSYRDWTGEVHRARPIPMGHTDFVQLPGGGFAMLAWTVQEHGGELVLGDQIIEWQADGTTRMVWDVFDTLEPDLSREWLRGFFGENDRMLDWSHVNSLSYDAATDDFLVTITANDGVARIDRSTGAVEWMLSPQDGDFTIDQRDMLKMPHSVQVVDGGVLVFNRRSPGDRSICAGATEFALDASAGTAEVVFNHESGDCRQVSFLGSSLRLPGGNTLTSWSVYGVLDEVTPDGALAWEVSAGLGGAFGYVTFAPTLPGAAR